MKTALKPDHEINSLVELALDGNERAMTMLLDKHRAQLQHLVSLRMDRRIQGRVDAADIVQDALIDAARRLSEFRDQNKMGFYVWLRWITSERLLNTHRRHLGSQIRDAKREVPIDRQEPDATPIALSQQLAGRLTSPTKVVARRELQMAIENVLEQLDPDDRAILMLRNFEELSLTQTAKALGIKRSTAGKRHIRALKRLRKALDQILELHLYCE